MCGEGASCQRCHRPQASHSARLEAKKKQKEQEAKMAADAAQHERMQTEKVMGSQRALTERERQRTAIATPGMRPATSAGSRKKFGL